jgi:glycosyltransferase involved in cell wall biosynthesis
LKILICHNYYARRSGEESVVERESALLKEKGHSVSIFSYDNRDAQNMNPAGLGLRALYSRQTGRDLMSILRETEFDIAHVHNTWLLMSPTVYKYLWQDGIPVVKTVHNYRWLCPVATFYRDGIRCHDCVEKIGGVLHGIVHKCYLDSLSGSSTASARLFLHRDLLQTFNKYIDVIVVQNNFVKEKLIAAGFPAERMAVKGNFLKRDEIVQSAPGDFYIAAGRLEPAKGLATLLDACEETGIRTKIFGEGPMHDWLQGQIESRFAQNQNVQLMGYVSRQELLDNFATTRALIFPSEWYESYPISIVEAMAHGKPVIASNIGGMLSIVDDGMNGLLFEVGNSHALASKLNMLWEDDNLYEKLSRGARETYEKVMSPEVHYDLLMKIYQSAIDRRQSSSSGLNT